ncbi:hypothetical protein BI347_19035 [Chromobacterium sphagni]|uniref:HTH luxR-type domain-containing protein n=1 Tax=Chromobacterium sphagni TaxID=1903179 RepID=A0A1S1WS65_9NEIS|nr:LuxR family transcriptional regulator [Chromobacterium sphagni]OHX10061.1 hypothetical protein BI347_22385 [Chromobacterium sphagni]OHX10626.1 hypothetical protein BI347_19035 [Chromobacterium sphagni]
MQDRIRQLLVEVPPWSAYSLLAIHEQLASLSSVDELTQWLRGLRNAIPLMPPVLLAISGRGRYLPQLHRVIYHDWPADWLERYDDPGFRSADPILSAPAGQPVHWSAEFARLKRPTLSQRKFLASCRNNGMTHGVSFISDQRNHRVILSLSGQRAEEDAQLIRMIEMVWTHIVQCARRLLLPKNRLFELSPRERDVVELISLGESYRSTAAALGIDETTVTDHVNRMVERYGANNSRHLVKILFSCTD